MLLRPHVEASSGPEVYGVFAQTVYRCPYDDSCEPKLLKQYKWFASWKGIKGLNAKCKCQSAHRLLGIRTSSGGWIGDHDRLGESAAYPDRLGEAMFNMWRQHCNAIDVAWSHFALSMSWVDPRHSNKDTAAAPEQQVQTVSRSGLGRGAASPEQQVAKASKSNSTEPCNLGPWGSSGNPTPKNKHVKMFKSRGVITPTSGDPAPKQKDVKKSKSRGVITSISLGPWGSAGDAASRSSGSSSSSKSGSVKESRGATPKPSDTGPWGCMDNNSSPDSEFNLGPWASAASGASAPSTSGHASRAAKVARPSFGPWGSVASSSSSDDLEAAPGQIGSPIE